MVSQVRVESFIYRINPEFPLITLAEETTIDDTEEPEEESIDELDFSMF